MPKYVYTGYSHKEEGFLILTNADWDELVERLGCRHVRRTTESGVEQDVFTRPDATEQAVEDALVDCEPRWGVWLVYRAEAKCDENLAAAICW